jgi:hypothetical protein
MAAFGRRGMLPRQLLLHCDEGVLSCVRFVNIDSPQYPPAKGECKLKWVPHILFTRNAQNCRQFHKYIQEDPHIPLHKTNILYIRSTRWEV